MVLTLKKPSVFNLKQTLFSGGRHVVMSVLLQHTAAAQQADVNASSAADDYYFDARLFKGSGLNQEAFQKLAKPAAILPGDYTLDVSVNNLFLGRFSVSVKTRADNALPCFSTELIQAIGFRRPAPAKSGQTSCVFMDEIEPRAVTHLSISDFSMNIIVPQSLLNQKPRGWINPAEYDTGINAAFANYLVNYYHVSYADSELKHQDSAWLALNGGVNLGTWQYRQSGSASWNPQQGATWRTLRRYVQRPLPGIESELMAGQLITSGHFFSGLSYSGMNLSTVESMLPDTQQGYAPVIRGIANTNAKISVRQNGNEIYQTTVPPGAFEISDLNATSSSGDLQVAVTEADGTVRTFVVPFSAVPESIRPGLSRYSIAAGKTRNMRKNAQFGDVLYQRGLTNALTGNGGLRVSEGYLSAVLGGVYASLPGAIGSDLTFSRAAMPHGETLQGWMSHINWSKTFTTTGTTVSLASYRYSTTGYRDLSAILGLRYSAADAVNWLQYASEQRERYDLTLSQNMDTLGNIFVTAATQSYRNSRPRDTQFQAGFSKSFDHGISVSVAINRQQTGSARSYGARETAISATLSVPLFSGSARAASLSTTFNHSEASGSQYQTSLSGTLDEQQQTTYSVSVARDQQQSQNTLSASLQERLAKATLGANASAGKNYWQLSGNMQGSAALHAGGLTLGPYLGETFGLVDARGAEGARLFSASPGTVDDSGYMLIPSMTPYRYNAVSLDPAGMNGNAELLDNLKRVVPVAGAVSRITFRTQTGSALLIAVSPPHGRSIPMGSSAYDEQNEPVGVAGQGNQVYVRTEKQRGSVIVSLDDNTPCRIPFSLNRAERDMALIGLTASCGK